jgi:hypothetical protein
MLCNIKIISTDKQYVTSQNCFYSLFSSHSLLSLRVHCNTLHLGHGFQSLSLLPHLGLHWYSENISSYIGTKNSKPDIFHFILFLLLCLSLICLLRLLISVQRKIYKKMIPLIWQLSILIIHTALLGNTCQGGFPSNYTDMPSHSKVFYLNTNNFKKKLVFWALWYTGVSKCYALLQHLY